MDTHAWLIIPLYLTSIATLWLLVRLTIRDMRSKEPPPEQILNQPAKPLNGKTVYLTADHERKIAARMSQGEAPHEDIW